MNLFFNGAIRYNKLQIENYFCSTVNVTIHPIALKSVFGMKITISNQSFVKSLRVSPTIFSVKQSLRCAHCPVRWMSGIILKSEPTNQLSPVPFDFTYRLKSREKRKLHLITFNTLVSTKTFSITCANRTWEWSSYHKPKATMPGKSTSMKHHKR